MQENWCKILAVWHHFISEHLEYMIRSLWPKNRSLLVHFQGRFDARPKRLLILKRSFGFLGEGCELVGIATNNQTGLVIEPLDCRVLCSCCTLSPPLSHLFSSFSSYHFFSVFLHLPDSHPFRPLQAGLGRANCLGLP